MYIFYKTTGHIGTTYKDEWYKVISFLLIILLLTLTILCQKCVCYYSNIAVKLVPSYLKDYDCNKSNSFLIPRAMAQGSVHGPLSYIIYLMICHQSRSSVMYKCTQIMFN